MWVDPMDPWSWVASRWLLEVEQVRAVDLRFHVMSVALVNAGRDIPEQYRDAPEAYLERMSRSWGPVRVAAAAVTHAGEKVLRELYTAMGTRIHVKGESDLDTVVADALDEVGLPAELAAAAVSDEHDEQVNASTRAGMDAVGLQIGTPIVRLAAAAFFGPVISKIPRGEDAGRLFDALVTLGGFPHLSEVKRARISEPDFS
jgi:hypothetical protein